MTYIIRVLKREKCRTRFSLFYDWLLLKWLRTRSTFNFLFLHYRWHVCECVVEFYISPVSLSSDSWREEGDGVLKEGPENRQPVHGPVIASAALHWDPEQIRLFLRKREWRGMCTFLPSCRPRLDYHSFLTRLFRTRPTLWNPDVFSTHFKCRRSHWAPWRGAIQSPLFSEFIGTVLGLARTPRWRPLLVVIYQRGKDRRLQLTRPLSSDRHPICIRGFFLTAREGTRPPGTENRGSIVMTISDTNIIFPA